MNPSNIKRQLLIFITVQILKRTDHLEESFLKNPNDNLKELENIIIEQEEALRFSSLSYADCYSLGVIVRDLYAKAAYTAPIVIDITLNGHQVFHLAYDGSSPDNDAFIKRKYATVQRFRMSSMRMGLMMAQQGTTMPAKYDVPAEEYGAFGGGFPIKLTSGIQIGVFCISVRFLITHLTILIFSY